MAAIDLLILGSYLAAIFLVGVLVGRKEKLDDFFVNQRRTKTLLLVFTVVSTNAGAGTLVGIASAGYSTGISFGLTAFIATVVGFLFAAALAPKIKEFGDQKKAYSLGDYFLHRYSDRNRNLVGAILVIAYIFFTSAQYVGVSALLRVWTGLDITITLAIAAGTMILYTAFAGIKSDFYTDVIHFVVMFVCLVLIVLPDLLLNEKIVSHLSSLPSSFYHPFSFGGVGFFFGSLIFGAPFMLVSMEIWQRIYAATNPHTARKTMFWSAALNLPFVICGIVFGLSGRALFGNSVDQADQVLFRVISVSLPSGLLGLALAGILAAFLSTANSMIMVTSTTVFKDFYMPLRKSHKSEKELLRAGRVITLIVGIVSLIFAVFLPSVIQQILNGYYVILVLFPPVIGGFLWKKADEKAAFLGILTGFVVTIALLPLLPKMAFVPGVFLSGTIFVWLSLRTWGKKQYRQLNTASN
jgi:SSS family solute:Na+ symporter